MEYAISFYKVVFHFQGGKCTPNPMKIEFVVFA